MADEPKPELRRCPNCGASDLALNTDLGKIQCRHCKAIFDGKLADDDSEAEDLIDEDVLVTFHCSSCGAEVTLNANETLSAQCHWCRHIFSLNEKVLNGAVPDLVLPFKVKREVAMKKISDRITSMPRDYYDATKTKWHNYMQEAINNPKTGKSKVNNDMFQHWWDKVSRYVFEEDLELCTGTQVHVLEA